MRTTLAQILTALALSACVSGHENAVVRESASRTPASQFRCQDLFSPPPLPLALSDTYEYRMVNEMRIGSSKDGLQDMVQITSYSVPIKYNKLLQTEILEPVRVPAIAGARESELGKTSVKKNRAAWRKAVRRSVDFVLDKYADRREHWPESFRLKLLKMAKDTLNVSTYITVRLTEDSASREYGTLRLIEESNQKLPMEDYLGIRIDSKGARKFEPGNFAIDRSVNEYTFSSILIHVVEAILKRSSRTGDAMFYTYADRQSLILYKMLGFKPIARESLNLQPGTVLDQRGRIRRDGVDWTPMSASASDFYDLLQKYFEGDLKQHGAPEIRDLMKRRWSTTIDPTLFSERVVRGESVDSKGKSEGCELHVKIDNANPDAPKTTLYFRRDSTHAFRGYDPVHIPANPLVEGMKTVDVDGTEITYSGGRLIQIEFPYPEDRSQFIRTEISISPDLKTVRSYERRFFFNGRETDSLQAGF